jgi:hypothetical protein
MCRKPCCPPQGSSGTGTILVIAAIIIAATVLHAIWGLLKLIMLITLTSIAALAVLGLVTWAVITWRRRTTTRTRAATRARQATAMPPGHVPMIDAQPAPQSSGTNPPGRAPTTEHERLARQFADAIASYDDPAVAENLIRRALRANDT